MNAVQQTGRIFDSNDGSETVGTRAKLSTILASTPGIAEQGLKVTLEGLSAVQIIGRAPGCLSALQMVREKRTDLVVLDANLPSMDVLALVRQIKEEGLPTRSLVLASTERHVRGALTAGADAALRRDVPIADLKAVLDRFRNQSPQQRLVINDAT